MQIGLGFIYPSGAVNKICIFSLAISLTTLSGKSTQIHSPRINLFPSLVWFTLPLAWRLALPYFQFPFLIESKSEAELKAINRVVVKETFIFKPSRAPFAQCPPNEFLWTINNTLSGGNMCRLTSSNLHLCFVVQLANPSFSIYQHWQVNESATVFAKQTSTYSVVNYVASSNFICRC